MKITNKNRNANRTPRRKILAASRDAPKLALLNVNRRCFLFIYRYVYFLFIVAARIHFVFVYYNWRLGVSALFKGGSRHKN